MTYRVIQWATGQCGAFAVEAIQHRPDLELVGTRVFSSDKAGRDAGEICGLGEIGIIASDDEQTLLDLDADCVLWMGAIPMDPGGGIDELCRILASGKDVITLTHTWYFAPDRLPADRVAPIEEACRQGGSTLHATGMEPGFVNDVLAPALTSLCGRVDFVEMRELLTYDQWISPMLFSVMPFGQEPGESDMAFMEAMGVFFEPNIHVVADALGVEIDDIRYDSDTALAPESFHVPTGHVAAGTIGAIRFSWTGYIDGVPRIRTEHINRLRDDIATEWMDRAVDGHGYDVRIEGKPSMYLGLDFSDDAGARPAVQTALLATAMRAVNAVPAVCEARPGIVTTSELTGITGLHSMGH